MRIGEFIEKSWVTFLSAFAVFSDLSVCLTDSHHRTLHPLHSFTKRGADDSDDEEEDSTTLKNIEKKRLEFDPNFNEVDTYASQSLIKKKLTNTFLRGSNYFADDLEKKAKVLDSTDQNEATNQEAEISVEELTKIHQLHMNVERFRVPEVLFQPHMAGIDQAGIDEISSHILNGFEDSIKQKMLKVRER